MKPCNPLLSLSLSLFLPLTHTHVSASLRVFQSHPQQTLHLLLHFNRFISSQPRTLVVQNKSLAQQKTFTSPEILLTPQIAPPPSPTTPRTVYSNTHTCVRTHTYTCMRTRAHTHTYTEPLAPTSSTNPLGAMTFRLVYMSSCEKTNTESVRPCDNIFWPYSKPVFNLRHS